MGLFSCSDDIQSNNPIIQGEVNGEEYRTSDVSASTANVDGLLITGESLDQVVLKTSSASVGVYNVVDDGSMARLVRNGQEFIASGEDAEGIIEIEKSSNGKVSGNFYFNAQVNGSGDVLNFSKGVFFGVPVNGLAPEEPEMPGQNGSFEAAINGSDFEVIAITANTNGGNVLITAGGGAQSITLRFPNPIEVGEYAFEDNENISGSILEAEGMSESTSGTLTIDESTETNISGTFSFTTESGDQVSGSFNIIL